MAGVVIAMQADKKSLKFWIFDRVIHIFLHEEYAMSTIMSSK